MIRALLLALLCAPSVALAQDAGRLDAAVDADADAGTDAEAGMAAAVDAAIDADSDAGAEADAALDAFRGPADEAPLPVESRPQTSIHVRNLRALATGDLVQLEVIAEAREGDDVAVPPQPFTPFEVHSRAFREERADGKVRFVFSLALLALEPGEHTVGPVRLRVVTREGVIGIVETDTVAVNIASVLGNEPDAQPKPPTRPVQVMEDNYTLLYVLIAIGVLLLVGILALLFGVWWSRRPKAVLPPPPPRPPWELASEKLQVLARKRTADVERGAGAEWVDATSDTVREYLGRRFGFDGLESTSDEVMARMRRVHGLPIPVEEILFFLTECDLVKFAKVSANLEQTAELLARAERIVQMTIPRPVYTPPQQQQMGPPPQAPPPQAPYGGAR